MATKTLADLTSTVRFRGDFRNTVRYPDTNVQGEIQSAWAELYELIANVNEGYWDTSTTLTTTAAQDYVALPSDAWRVRALDRLDTSDWIQLGQVGISERNRYSTQNEQPRAFRLSARGIELYPTPDQAYTLRLMYTPRAPTLDTSAREYFNSWDEFVIYGALVRLVLQEDRSSTQWAAEFERERQRVISGASQRRASEPEYLPIRDMGLFTEFDRDQRWR